MKRSTASRRRPVQVEQGEGDAEEEGRNPSTTATPSKRLQRSPSPGQQPAHGRPAPAPVSLSPDELAVLVERERACNAFIRDLSTLFGALKKECETLKQERASLAAQTSTPSVQPPPPPPEASQSPTAETATGVATAL